MDDVWKSPESDLEPRSGATPLAEGSTDPMDVPRAVWADLTGHALGYVAMGAGYLGFAFLYAFVVVGALAMVVVPAAMTEDETLLFAALAIGMTGYTLAILGVVFVVIPPMMASSMRAIDRQRRGEGRAGAFDIVALARPNLGRVIGFYLLQNLVVLVGMLFFYLPGLVAAAVCSFAFPIVVFEDVGPAEALKLGWDHVKSHAAWHVVVWLMLFVVLVIAELTVFGLLILFPVMMAWQLFAYRLAFGEQGASGRPLPSA